MWWAKKKVGFAFALPTLQFNISDAGYNLTSATLAKAACLTSSN
ncbi:hypothetical protein QUF54_09300 [Candidatus Marithioploca araucensis]|uniref:Uncharacterized protein n=1 Tax=Candidatus Marithioploca araucensis TaxID=70273 RepID=A0ABT7VVG4_9GAMM|nr:hypothetical protein [Candidatus Marithioploca araucensis]